MGRRMLRLALAGPEVSCCEGRRRKVRWKEMIDCAPPPLPLQVAAADGRSKKVFVIDEIGKMELFSQSFIRAVRQTLEGSSVTILGTIPVPKGKPLGLVEEVRSRSDIKVFTVSKKKKDKTTALRRHTLI